MQSRLTVGIGRLAREQEQTHYNQTYFKNRVDDVRRFPPLFLVDVSMCYDGLEMGKIV